MEQPHLVQVLGVKLPPLYKGTDERPRTLVFRMPAKDQQDAADKVRDVLQLEDIPYDSIGGSSVFKQGG